MENKKFQTETKKLLDLMINSIYTHKEIFLRELVSNASDAIDKRRFLALTDQRYLINKEDEILIEADKENRILTITDTGIGMSHDDVINNLGTIAKSGSKEFLEQLENAKNGDVDIIGQFGVGFYSAFMVSKKVVVYTKKPTEEKGYIFTSDGFEKYSVEEVENLDNGTRIVLYLKDNSDEEKYDSYLEFYKIQSLIKKYSDYIRYPIKTYQIKSEPILDADGKETEEYSETKELVTLNSMEPLWKKNKSEVTDEQLNEFYKAKFSDFEDPLISMFTKVEGNVTYNSICYIPAHVPYNLYSEEYERGLQLYTKGVFILDKCKELIPNYLRFVKGLVDSSDLSLNISREMLQHDRQISKIASNLEKKILSELAKVLKNDREKYEKFFDVFGVNLKYGIYEDYGVKKDDLQDLILFKSLNNDKYVTLKEYVEAMKEDQKDIYYISGKNKENLTNTPQLDSVKKHGYDVLLLTDEVDEFMIMILQEYDSHKLISVTSSQFDILSDEEKKQLEEEKESDKDILALIKESLVDDVSEVTLSTRLTDSALCLVSGEGISLEMERVLNEMPNNGGGIKAKRILEINPNHELYKAIKELYGKDQELVKKYSTLLYDQALIIEGMPVKDPVNFSKLMCELMVNLSK